MEKELQKKSLDRFFRNEYQKLVNFIKKNLDETLEENDYLKRKGENTVKE